MTKYFIEDNIDFYKILQQSLTETTEYSVQEQLCLISTVPLTEHYVRMDCGHAFNYIPLYNEIIKQKFRLKYNTTYVLQCPYCRAKHSNLLPYYPELNVNLVYGVNTDDIFYKMVIDKRTSKLVYENTLHYFLNGQCCYNYTHLDSDLEMHITPCENTCVIVHAETSKMYCVLHIQEAKKLYRIQEKAKEKDAKQKKKAEEKQKIKEEKLKLKEDTKKINMQHNRCGYMLTTGPNKGTQCKNKQLENSLCKTHLSKGSNTENKI
uniref:Uncharacterized protein n=1 Tax=viral metagenome TaxID=1070528 RepID=A0A6C0E492_9ZZZZ